MAKTKLMTFDEFHASWDAAEEQPQSDTLHQQREFLRDAGSADAILQPGALPTRGWPEWPSA